MSDLVRNLFSTTTTTTTMQPSTTTTISHFMHSAYPKYGVEQHVHMSATAGSTCSPLVKNSCNAGQCVLLSGTTYACRCREGYTGTYCENS